MTLVGAQLEWRVQFEEQGPVPVPLLLGLVVVRVVQPLDLVTIVGC